MFKVGDKVKIIGRSGAFHFFPTGTVTEVMAVDNGNGNLELRGHDGDGIMYEQTVSPHDVVLYVNHEEPVEPEPIASVLDLKVTPEEAKKSNILFMAHLYHGLDMSFRQVAKLTGVHERTVRRRFKKYGVPSRPKNGAK